MVGAGIEMMAFDKRIAEELPLVFEEIPEQSLYELVWAFLNRYSPPDTPAPKPEPGPKP
jgi:hypothetical protein